VGCASCDPAVGCASCDPAVGCASCDPAVGCAFSSDHMDASAEVRDLKLYEGCRQKPTNLNIMII
jgi:hypothetical protein